MSKRSLAIYIEDIMRSSSKQINVVPGLTLPIFDSGRLNAGLAIARSQSNIMIAQYNRAVLNAVREVAQYGIELEGLNQRVVIENTELKAVPFNFIPERITIYTEWYIESYKRLTWRYI